MGEHFLSLPPTAISMTVEAVEPAAVAAAAALVDAAPAVVDVDVDELDIGPLQRVAERGDARAQAELGERYEEGRGVERDYGAAVCSGLVPSLCATRRGARPGKSRRHLLQRNRRAAGGRRGAEVVSSRCRAGRRPRAERPRRDARERPSACVGTMRRLYGGAVARRSRATPWVRPNLGYMYSTAKGCGGTTRKPSGGTAAPPSRASPSGSTTSAADTSRAGVCGGIDWKLPSGAAWQSNRARRSPEETRRPSLRTPLPRRASRGNVRAAAP